MGRGEEYWKKRIEEGRARLTLLLEKMQSLNLRYNSLTAKYNESRSSAERGTLSREREPTDGRDGPVPDRNRRRQDGVGEEDPGRGGFLRCKARMAQVRKIFQESSNNDRTDIPVRSGNLTHGVYKIKCFFKSSGASCFGKKMSNL